MSLPTLPPKDGINGVAADPWRVPREFGKYTATIAIMVIAFYLLSNKLSSLNWPMFWAGLKNISVWQIAGALGLVVINYLVLTGYDLIAVRYLQKDVPLSKVMLGAVVGYALSNVLGWIFGGTAVRYRMYTSWGFSFKEVVALISILSLTFWLGMFLLAGLAFTILPVTLPDEIEGHSLRWFKQFGAHIWGWLFLAAVALYLAACAFWREPIRWGKDEFRLPPIGLSAQQLVVSACDFALASATLYVLLPGELFKDPTAYASNLSTVLVAYLAGMIITVTLHIPGGFGVLDYTLLSMLGKEKGSAEEAFVVAGLVVYRVLYYFLPAAVATVLFFWNEVAVRRASVSKPAV
jgi:glycosyltransferase 2 family protein